MGIWVVSRFLLLQIILIRLLVFVCKNFLRVYLKGAELLDYWVCVFHFSISFQIAFQRISTYFHCSLQCMRVLEARQLHQHLVLFLLFFFFFKLFIYFWLCWVFVSVRGLSLVVASGGHSSSRCAGLSLSWPLLLQSIGSRCAGSAVVAHGPSCSAACGIFPDQGLNPCPLHWQADSQPLRHQGSPVFTFKIFMWNGILLWF